MHTLCILLHTFAYFYPLLKVHKIEKDKLVPGVNPPARLVTALQEGVSSRSDIFIAGNYLKQVEHDFCEDLLGDTSDALRWLDNINSSLHVSQKKLLKSFSFDFKSLYDSLNIDLVIQAVRHAIEMTRPDWSEPFSEWIITLIHISFRSAVGKFKNDWYRQVNGIPTGGSLCVQRANITVFYVMQQVVYSDPNMMKEIQSIM